MVSARSPTFSSSSPLIKLLEIVPCASVRIVITVKFMFNGFLSSLARSKYLSCFSLSLIFTLWSAGVAKSTVWQVLFFFCWLSLGLVVWLGLGDLFVSQNPRELLLLLLLLLLLFASFSHERSLMIFYRRLSDSKSSQVPRTPTSIMVDLNNAVVWMGLSRFSISNSTSPLTKRLETVPSAPITIGIPVTFLFHNFFSSLAKSKYLCLSFLWFSLLMSSMYI